MADSPRPVRQRWRGLAALGAICGGLVLGAAPPALAQDLVRVAGTFIDACGTPLAGATLTLTVNTVDQVATADSHGHVSLQVPPGSFPTTVSWTSATAADGSICSPPTVLVAGTVTVTGNTDVSLALPTPADVPVTVVDSHGAPVAGAEIFVGNGIGTTPLRSPIRVGHGLAITQDAGRATSGADGVAHVFLYRPGTAQEVQAAVGERRAELVQPDLTRPLPPLVLPGLPDPVARPAARSVPAAAVVTWAAPANDGGAPIDSYAVTATPVGSPATPPAQTTYTPGSPTRVTFTGLVVGTSYTFTVTAHNRYGSAAASPASAPVQITAPTPVMTRLSPKSGPAAGGTRVTVTGSAFTGATEVLFGRTPATSFVVVSDRRVVAVSPRLAPGSTVPVRVRNSSGRLGPSLSFHAVG